jgi:hypothetical protein
MAISQGGVVEADGGCGGFHDARMSRVLEIRFAAGMISVAFYDVSGCDVAWDDATNHPQSA